MSDAQFGIVRLVIESLSDMGGNYTRDLKKIRTGLKSCHESEDWWPCLKIYAWMEKDAAVWAAA